MDFWKKVISLILIITGLIMICIVWMKYFRIKKEYQNIRTEVLTKVGNDKNIINWNKLKNVNENVAAWITVPGTEVDYPVVMAKDNEYYLSHDISGNSSQYGAIFFDARYSYISPFKASNLILYGHNMGHWTNVMFGDLEKYKSKEFYDKHNRIILYTRKAIYEYQIISVMKVFSNDRWFDFVMEDKEHPLEAMFKYATESSLYQCRLPERIDDKFISLSTCDYNDTYRLVIVGNKMKEKKIK